MDAPQHSELLGRPMAAVALIDAEQVAGRAEPAARRRRQIKLVSIGRHPYSLVLRLAFSTGQPLHSKAPRQIDARPSAMRCGTCKFAAPLDASSSPGAPAARPLPAGAPAEWARGAFKCFNWPELVTRGQATDIRLMWPACRAWRPRDVPAAVAEAHADDA